MQETRKQGKSALKEERQPGLHTHLRGATHRLEVQERSCLKPLWVEVMHQAALSQLLCPGVQTFPPSRVEPGRGSFPAP